MIIGLDTGGTHVDAVLIDKGEIIDWAKGPTDRENLFASIWQTLEKLLHNVDPQALEWINLSTTITTNSIVEGKGSPVAMFVQGGPGINPLNFSCGEHLTLLDGFIDHRGEEIKSFSPEILDKELKIISAQGIKNAGVVTKFSTRNPVHELKVKDYLAKKGFSTITMGHTLSGKLNFPRRIHTTFLNSATADIFNNFAQGVKEALKDKGLSVPLYILKADGGTMALEEAIKYPVQSILSGPAASVMGSLAFNDIKEDTLLLDIGGTTTDISFLVDGVPLFEPAGIEISQYPTLVRAIYSASVGLGGDSAVKVTENQELEIGPERQGPPMALGGPVPTPSDAMIVLDKMNFGDREKALRAMEIIGKSLNISVLEAAQQVYEKFGDILKEKVTEILIERNNHPVYTIHELLHGRKIVPQGIIAIGGPAQGLAPLLEDKFGLKCTIPENYSFANAIGAALTKRTMEITLLADTDRGILSVPELQIYKKINSKYHLELAEKEALDLLRTHMQNLGTNLEDKDLEITEAVSFNMVSGFWTSGKNIRIRAQVKPGLISKMGGANNVKS